MAPVKVENVVFFNIREVQETPRMRRGPIATAFRFVEKKRWKMVTLRGGVAETRGSVLAVWGGPFYYV